MEEIQGQRRGTTIFTYRGFQYHQDRRYPRFPGDNERFVCASRSSHYHCLAVLWRNPQTRHMELHGGHDHRRPTSHIVRPAIQQLQQRALENDDLPNNIVNQVFR
ncbi:hypothetical protein KQX54_000233, partial [Cotesia glomerata]